MTVVGIGARSDVTTEEVLAAVDAVLPADATDVRIATLAARAGEPGIAGAAAARGWRLTGYSATELAQILNGMVDARAVDELIGTYRMAVVVGASELLLGESVEDFIERRAAGPFGPEGVRIEGVGYAMLHEAMAQAKARASQ